MFLAVNPSNSFSFTLWFLLSPKLASPPQFIHFSSFLLPYLSSGQYHGFSRFLQHLRTGLLPHLLCPSNSYCVHESDWSFQNHKFYLCYNPAGNPSTALRWSPNSLVWLSRLPVPCTACLFKLALPPSSWPCWVECLSAPWKSRALFHSLLVL